MILFTASACMPVPVDMSMIVTSSDEHELQVVHSIAVAFIFCMNVTSTT